MTKQPTSLIHTVPYQSSVVSFLFSIKAVAFRVFVHLNHYNLVFVQLRVVMFVSLPSLYIFASCSHGFLLLYLLAILAFSITLFICLKFWHTYSLPSKFGSVTKASKPVIWSIGSKPKVEKKQNSGCGVVVYNNGDVYEGEFHKGKCTGSGVYYYHMTGKYEGEWVDEKYDGYGIETWVKGSRYRGQYRQGLRHGIGVYRFFTGDDYSGEWCNGQSHGCGIHTCEDGSKYVGEFKWGVKHGLGRYHFRNGDVYAGEYFADKMHGFGVYTFGNGHVYEGAWHEGRRQGLGVYTFKNGDGQSGYWRNGVLGVASIESSDPESPHTVSHSKVLNVVQEAQRAAEKAYSVGRIEERVNRVVLAANKAANAGRVAAVKAVQSRMHSRNCENIFIPSI